ncbi:hypothetical protein Tco_1125086 [Tanacetum coccineum]|uniref:Uncharacterized protein n=1 Tax=Tanacetum coccineum TaxID=301880 RepID=A0ABQ5J8M2_9ASTR
MNDIILSNNNTTADSFFKPYMITRGKYGTEKEDEQSQTKCKYSKTSASIDEQPNKRMCKAEKFEAIHYSLGPNEEYIAIRRCEYDIWERNKVCLPRHQYGVSAPLKDEALRNKVIMEGLISDDESCIDCWKRWKSHEIYYHNYDEEECENKTHEEGHELCSIKTRKVPVCQIKRYNKIKYSFKDEEYVAIKADEYDDLTITSEEDCRSTRKLSDDD